MKLSRRTLLLLTLTAGCSGGSGPSTPTGVIFTLDWPDASRVLPLAAKSVQVQIKQGSKVLVSRLYVVGPDSDEQLTDLPFATPLTLEASAYTTSDGTGAVLASATIPFNTLKGKLERITLTLSSVISRVELATVTDGDHTDLTATARDAAGSVVLTTAEQWEWTSSNTALGTLTPTGATARFTETGFGVTTLIAREKESSKSAIFERPVCRGIPSTALPTRATYPLIGPISDLYPLGDGRFIVVHGNRVACVDATGATVWQRALPYTGAVVAGIVAGHVVLSQPTQPALRIHRLEDGSLYWEEALKVTGPLQTDGSGLFYLPLEVEKQQRFEARSITLGTVAWTKLLDGRALVWADSSRLLRYSDSDSSFSTFHATLGTPLWESRVPAGSRFLAVRTGSSPLLFSLALGEVRATLLSNGVRLWSNTTETETTGFLTPDGQQLIVFGGGSVRGFNPTTGALLWSRSDLPTTLAPTTNGSLLAHPPIRVPGCLPLQALTPSTGVAAWTNYLPTSFTHLSTTGALTLVQRSTELYGLDTATGVYRWGLTNPGTEPPVLSGITVAIEERPASRLHLLY